MSIIFSFKSRNQLFSKKKEKRKSKQKSKKEEPYLKNELISKLNKYSSKPLTTRTPVKEVVTKIVCKIVFIGGKNPNFLKKNNLEHLYIKLTVGKLVYHSLQVLNGEEFSWPKESYSAEFFIQPKSEGKSKKKSLLTLEAFVVPQLTDGDSTISGQPKKIALTRFFVSDEELIKSGGNKEFSVKLKTSDKPISLQFMIERVREVKEKPPIQLNVLFCTEKQGNIKKAIILRTFTMMRLRGELQNNFKEKIVAIYLKTKEETIELTTDEQVKKLEDKCDLQVKFKRKMKTKSEMRILLGKYIIAITAILEKIDSSEVSPNYSNVVEIGALISKVNSMLDYKEFFLFKGLEEEEMLLIKNELNLYSGILKRTEEVDKTKGFIFAKRLLKEIKSEDIFHQIQLEIKQIMSSTSVKKNENIKIIKTKRNRLSFLGITRTKKRRLSFGKKIKGVFNLKSRSKMMYKKQTGMEMADFISKQPAIALTLKEIGSQKLSKLQERKLSKFVLKFKGIKMIKYQDLTLKKYIDSGSSSTVYLALYKNEEVCYKQYTVPFDKLLEQTERQKDFEKELNVFQICKHHNILRLIGMVVQKNHVGIITEYCQYGDLKSFLKKNKISFNVKVRILYEICCVMSYLHSKKIIHRDLKLGNVLISKDLGIKLMDFGISKVVGRTSITKSKAGSVGTHFYMAPEQFSGNYDNKVDVYAFAILCFIVITEKFNPYRKTKDEESYSEGKFMMKIINEEEFRPSFGKKTLKKKQRWIKDLCTSCWAYNPKRRPSLKKVLEIFEEKMVSFDYKATTIRLPKKKRNSLEVPKTNAEEEEEGEEDEIEDEMEQQPIKAFIKICNQSNNNKKEIILKKFTLEEMKRIVKELYGGKMTSLKIAVQPDDRISEEGIPILTNVQLERLKENTLLEVEHKIDEQGKVAYLTYHKESGYEEDFFLKKFNMDGVYELIEQWTKKKPKLIVKEVYLRKVGMDIKSNDDMIADLEFSDDDLIFFIEFEKFFIKVKTNEDKEFEEFELKEFTFEGIKEAIKEKEVWKDKKVSKIKKGEVEIKVDEDLVDMENKECLIIEFLKEEKKEVKKKEEKKVEKFSFNFMDIKVVPFSISSTIDRSGIILFNKKTKEWDVRIGDKTYLSIILDELKLSNYLEECENKIGWFSRLTSMKEIIKEILQKESKAITEKVVTRIEEDFEKLLKFVK